MVALPFPQESDAMSSFAITDQARRLVDQVVKLAGRGVRKPLLCASAEFARLRTMGHGTPVIKRADVTQAIEAQMLAQYLPAFSLPRVLM
jgi:hypothetical protein